MIPFEKMHGLGNDFILLENINPEKNNLTELAKKLCDRHFGIGADGLILILPSETADIRMRIINSDGSEAAMCGNGIRCFAKYVFEKKLISKKKFTVETFAGTIIPELIIHNGKIISVKVNMGTPKFDRNDIPMEGAPGHVINEPLTVNGNRYHITSMLMSVPHTVIFADNLEAVDVINTGRLIEKNRLFPKGTNVNFVQIINKNEIKVRTWERGAGATLACGTGCCASAVASALTKKTGRSVIVHLEAGDLLIAWAEDSTVFMSGPAESVFTGQINITDLNN
jgi:diaminopimelate epimerase